MCYSARAWQDYLKFKREFGADPGIKEYIRLFWNWREKGTPYKFPKAMLGSPPLARTLQLSPMMGQEECHATAEEVQRRVQT